MLEEGWCHSHIHGSQGSIPSLRRSVRCFFPPILPWRLFIPMWLNSKFIFQSCLPWFWFRSSDRTGMYSCHQPIKQKREKKKVFAIGSPLYQALVRPIYDWAITVLARLRMDGTYNQTQPLQYLRGKKKWFSFDLKAANDSLPLILISSCTMLVKCKKIWKVLGSYNNNNMDRVSQSNLNPTPNFP